MKSLIFGSPGIPMSTQPRDSLNGVKQVRKLGLDAMEFEFVQNVHVNEKLAPEIKKVAEDLNVVLTCHGQYYVNLAALETEKLQASVNRMLSAARRMHECGGYSITWHMGYYLGRPKDKVHEIVTHGVKDVVKKLQDEGVKLWIRPETTGKETQWGDLQETIKLSQEVEQVMPCIDFGHLHARYNGTNNTLEEFRDILSQIEKGLGREALDNMHIQCCGINYGPKGEKNHLNFRESDFNWKDMLKAWKEFRIKGVVITESPNIEEDALFLQSEFAKL
jgi:deoxyribonuclease-4